MRTDGNDPTSYEEAHAAALGSIGYLLFDSLVHHLIEKGVLTRNDALSVVQSAAEVVRGQMDEGEVPMLLASTALSTLERTYSSFEALPVQPSAPQRDGHNVHPLRTPLHGDRPRFPSGD